MTPDQASAELTEVVAVFGSCMSLFLVVFVTIKIANIAANVKKIREHLEKTP